MYLKSFFTFGLIVILASLFSVTRAQVVVDSKNINEDREIEFVQLLYYIDKGSYKPVYFLDIGEIESDAPSSVVQRITIDTVAVNSNMTPVLVLNKLYKAGWEYIGDAIYISLPMRNDWHVFTLKRRKD